MKVNYQSVLCSGVFLLAGIQGFAQEKPPRPVEKLIVLDQTNAKSLAIAPSVLEERLDLGKHNKLSFQSEKMDELGHIHVKYQQTYKGLEVAYATTQVNAVDGNIQSLNNNLFRIKDLDVAPQVSESQALQNARNFVGANAYLATEGHNHDHHVHDHQEAAKLCVLPSMKGVSDKNRLVYRFDIYATDPVYRADVFVDAHSGEVVFENKRIHHADVPASGGSLYNGTVNFTADNASGPYRLRQTADGNGIQTYDMNNGTNYNNASDITSGSTSFNHATGVQAHWGAEQTHKYFMSQLGRNSYDGNGAVIRSYVSYSSNYNNAFWDGSRMTYGDGDGVNYGPLVALDIVGHEIAHGVTEYSANLVYSYESGALNESFSDIFGESIEKYSTGTNDWLMGDEIGSGGSGGALRSMSNPNAFGDPDTYHGTNWYFGSGDNGGVHYNSGVQNFWFYLLTTGGSGTNDNGDAYSVTGIGIDKAAAIAYRNLTVYLNANSQYADARTGAIQAAVDLYGAGSPEEIATTNAWHAVGVGFAYGSGPTCYQGDITLSITFDNYPEETAWTLKNSAGTTVASASYSTANPDGSTVNETFTGLAPDDYTFTITDAYGDGICCSYGNGSYSLSSSSGVFASGGSFGSSESKVFCIEAAGGGDTEAPSVPTGVAHSNVTSNSATVTWNASTDNVGVTGYEIFNGTTSIGTTTGTSANITGLSASTQYTINIQAYDAAGNQSASGSTTFTTGSSSSNVLSQAYFESGWDGWVDGGSDSYRYAGSRSYEGSYSIQLRDNTSSSTMTLGSFNLSSYTSVDVEFYFYAYSMETGEDFWLQFYDGSSWVTVAAWAAGTSFNNNGFYTTTVNIPAASYNFGSNNQFRFRCDASTNSDYIYIDAVTITANSGAPFAGVGVQTTHLGDVTELETVRIETDDFLIYPNPASAMVNIELGEIEEGATYRVLTISGQEIARGSALDGNINIEGYAKGVYLIEVQNGDELMTKRFTKF